MSSSTSIIPLSEVKVGSVFTHLGLSGREYILVKKGRKYGYVHMVGDYPPDRVSKMMLYEPVKMMLCEPVSGVKIDSPPRQKPGSERR
jgi:hypothetical protein